MSDSCTEVKCGSAKWRDNVTTNDDATIVIIGSRGFVGVTTIIINMSVNESIENSISNVATQKLNSSWCVCANFGNEVVCLH